MYGQRIKEQRILKGLTQGELAKLINFKSASAIGMIEREERELSLDSLSALATIFGVSTDYLLGKTVAPLAIITKSDDMPDVIKPFLKLVSGFEIEFEDNDFGSVDENKKQLESMMKERNIYDDEAEFQNFLELIPEGTKRNPISAYDLFYIIGNDKNLLEKLYEKDRVVITEVINDVDDDMKAIIESLKNASPQKKAKVFKMIELFEDEK